MATNKPQNEYMKTALRLPAPLHAQLHEAAAASGRSYNAEIVGRLQASLDSSALAHDTSKEALMADLAQERKEAANHYSHLSVVLAKWVINVIGMLSPTQRKASPHVDVVQSLAEVVIEGRGADVQKFIDFAASGPAKGET